MLPIHYNAVAQGFLYRHLEPELATSLHEEGIQEGKRKLKFFTFSRLIGNHRILQSQIVYNGTFYLVVASPMIEFLESLTLNLLKTDSRHSYPLRLGENRLRLIAAEVEFEPLYQNPVLLKALSPITMYSTLTNANGRKKTYYYSPFEEEFGRLILENLRRKVRVWYGVDIPPENASCRPYRVSSYNHHIVKYQETVIKAWSGIYELSAPEEYFRMALHAGLGAKGSQGFGCMAVYSPEKSKVCPS